MTRRIRKTIKNRQARRGCGLNFVAIDVETANADVSSICQVGIARYEAGKLVEEWSSLIDPEDAFDWWNINVHGISEEDVDGSPTFPEIADTIGHFLNGTVCVSHTHFDRIAIGRALDKYSLGSFQTTWLDSAKVARRAWKDFARRGYGLASVCAKIGYEFEHHDALEDAKACGEVVLAAMKTTGLDIESWLERVNQPIKRR
jgi:DNA polymerase-3 subunit epsilon